MWLRCPQSPAQDLEKHQVIFVEVDLQDVQYEEQDDSGKVTDVEVVPDSAESEASEPKQEPVKPMKPESSKDSKTANAEPKASPGSPEKP